MSIRAALVLCCLLPGLGGCGQKGSLYLPDAAPAAVPATPATSATPAADDPATRRKLPATPDPGSSQ